MSFVRSRALRIVLIGLGVVLFAGYFAFSTLVWNPFEGRLSIDVAALVPRDVDFFAAKADLDELFDPFPELAAREQLAAHPGWQAWVGSPQYQDLARDLDLERGLAELKTALAHIPLGMDLLAVFGGEDLAAAGYFRGADLAESDWALYGRANWLGRLGSALLFHPGLIGLSEQGIEATVEEDVVRLAGARLPRPLYVTRVQDVVVVATRVEMARKAHELHQARYEDSFLASALYHDFVDKAQRSAARDEVEVYVNSRKLVESLALTRPWPDPQSQDFTPAFLGRLFQAASTKLGIGVLGLDGGLSCDVHGELSSEKISLEQERLYRTKGFDQSELREIAALVPSDAAMAVYVRADVGQLIRTILASVEPALRTNLEDAFRSTGKYQKLEHLIAELEGALKDRALLIVRSNDYPPDPNGPPHDAAPMPAMALVLWPRDNAPLLALRNLIGQQGQRFKIRGAKEGDPGFYQNTEAGFETREYWSYSVPGTGVVATVSTNEITIVANSFRMLGHLLKTQTQGGDKYRRLADEPLFQALSHSSLPQANLFVWVNPRTAVPIWRALEQYHLGAEVNLDYDALRPLEEQKVLQERFGGRTREQLSVDEQEQLRVTVNDRFREMEANLEKEQLPAIVERQSRELAWLASFKGVLLMLALDPKHFELSLRAPYE